MHRSHFILSLSVCSLAGGTSLGSNWITYTNETALRLSAAPGLGSADPEEKDYAWGDLDKDGAVDLVVVRKGGWTTGTPRRNLLLMNENGVLTDRTTEFASAADGAFPLSSGFLDLTNDRDVVIVDVDQDTWLDVVTCTACISCGGLQSYITNPRLYMNLGNDGGGNWQGLKFTANLPGPNAPTYCSVAAGDLTNDGYPELYFVEYQETHEDQLLINGGPGNPGVFSVDNGRMTTAMRTSSFGTAAKIVDMDNDTWNDIVKSENGPQEIFRNVGAATPGTFNLLDPTYSSAAYHVGVGLLDGDGLMDVVLSDDGVDRYILNDGNIMDGNSEFNQSISLPASTGGFGSDSYIIDLNGDTYNDIIICDVDVDLSGCSRVTDILRNSGPGGGYTFSADAGNLTSGALTGVHDVAIFDINGDDVLDLVVGRCSSTQIWINSPPQSIVFHYPGGLPQLITPDEPTVFQVEITPDGDTIESGTEELHLSLNGGTFTTVNLTSLGGSLYEATLPGTSCVDRYDYYFSAELSGGLGFSDPLTAPSSTFTAIAAEGTQLLFAEDMEVIPATGWTVTSDASLAAGEWEQVTPIPTILTIGTENIIVNPGEDATVDGSICFVTENPASPGENPTLADVDFGPTFLTSPTFDLDGTNAFVSYAQWVVSEVGIHDALVVEISNNDGASWTTVETVTGTNGWETSSFFVGDFVTPTSTVKVRFGIQDNPNDSFTEGGVDDFQVDELTCVPQAPACPWDCDGSDDGIVGVDDFLAILAQWGQTGTSCHFAGGGVVGIDEFLDILAHWGACPTE